MQKISSSRKIKTSKKSTEKEETSKELVINDDFSYVSPKDGKTYSMTIKERNFCDYYLEFKGNGVDAVFEAGYEAKNALVAAAISHENLRKPNLIAYINSRLEETGFNDDEAFKQHLFLLNQHADLKSKAKAIEMYYKLKGINAPDKSINITLQVSKEEREKILGISSQVLEKMAHEEISG